MKLVLSIFWLILILSSCANRNFGYQVHPLEAGYYPRRLLIDVGPVKILDVQIVKK